MPSKNRIWRDQRDHLNEQLASQNLALLSQATPLVGGKANPALAELLSKDSIFFLQVRDDVSVMAIQPAGDDGGEGRAPVRTVGSS